MTHPDKEGQSIMHARTILPAEQVHNAFTLDVITSSESVKPLCGKTEFQSRSVVNAYAQSHRTDRIVLIASY